MTALEHAQFAREGVSTNLLGTSVLEHIGNTPLLRLEHVAKEFPNIEFCAKAEWFNPGGSVKDRPALSMIRAGIAAVRCGPARPLLTPPAATRASPTP